MKVEAWVFGSLTIFMIIVTPVYWLITADPVTGVPEITGTVALIMTTLLVLMIWVYLLLVAGRMEPRPEDRKTGEIAEGAGELGFFPPQSKWPLFLSLTFVPVVLGSRLRMVAHDHWFRGRLCHVDWFALRVLPRRSRALSGCLASVDPAAQSAPGRLLIVVGVFANESVFAHAFLRSAARRTDARRLTVPLMIRRGRLEFRAAG